MVLVGCLLGNLFAVCYFLGQEFGVGFFEVVPSLEPAAVPELLTATFQPLDLLFYGIAAYEGHKFSLRRVTDAELHAIASGMERRA